MILDLNVGEDRGSVVVFEPKVEKASELIAMLKGFVDEKKKRYETLTYTEEQCKDAKKDRAYLNNLAKQVADLRKKIESCIKGETTIKFLLDGLKEQENVLKELSSGIDEQVKKFEEMTKQKKKEEILNYFKSLQCDVDVAFEKIFEDRFLNATMSMSSVQEVVKLKIDKINCDYNCLANEYGKDEFFSDMKACFLETLDATTARQKRLNLIQEKENRLKFQEEQKIQPVKEQIEKPVEKDDIKEKKTFLLKITTTKDGFASLKTFLEVNNDKIEVISFVHSDEQI